jgi:hypothetical protein
MKVLLVTIAIGYNYLQEYKHLFMESQRKYALKHKYDFKVITEFLDDTYKYSHMSLYYQKILVCNQEWSNNYDFIIFIDADILININSPAIHNFINYDDCIGIIDEYSQPSRERRINIQKKMGWESSGTEYYKLCDFNLNTDMVFNSGVLVLQPKKHKDFLQNVYHKYIQKSILHKRGPHYEQTSLGYELQINKKFKVVDNKFNALWALINIDNIENNSLDSFFNENYFIHFAGRCDINRVQELHKYLL